MFLRNQTLFMARIYIFYFNRTVYDPEKGKLLEGCQKVLETLKKRGDKLILVSRYEGSRENLISELGLNQFFEKIVITENKTFDDFKKVVSEIGETKNVFVVGDRVRDEISFGNRLNLTTIWLKQGIFAAELPSREEEKPDYTVLKLEDILNLD